jgi:DNA-binding MarR family transcriptional regulator
LHCTTKDQVTFSAYAAFFATALSPAPEVSALSSAFEPPIGTVSRLEQALTRVVRLARPRLHRPALASVGGASLDPAAYATLAWIGEREGCRLSDLAALLAVDISTTSRQVRALELAGLVEVARHPGDQRAKSLSLTNAGRTLLGRARRAREQALAELVEEWPGSDVESLAALLERLAEALGQYPEENDDEAAQ